MNRKKLLLIALALVVTLCAMGGLLVYSSRAIEAQMTALCFDTLEQETCHLADELLKTVMLDKGVLQGEAIAIAAPETMDAAKVTAVMNSVDRNILSVSYQELLLPDNRLIHESGAILDAAGKLDFTAEAVKGAYVSEMTEGIFDAEDRVVRNAVPVVRDGKTIAVLYGVLSLRELSMKYKADVYDGNAYFYVINGSNGDFLVDTWHKQLGNIAALGKRKTLPGYSMERSIEDMRNGKKGFVGFVSKTTNSRMYMYYAPVGVNNWCVALTVTEEVAFAEARVVNATLIRLVILEVLLLSAFTAAIIYHLLRINRTVKRIGSEDQTTGLLNRNAFEERANRLNVKAPPLLVCAYIDVNGLHELNNKHSHAAGDQLLRTVADSLKAVFPYDDVFRVGGDEFVILREGFSQEDCEQKVQAALRAIEARGYSVSVGVVSSLPNQSPEDVINAADAKMLENKQRYYNQHDRRSRSSNLPPME